MRFMNSSQIKKGIQDFQAAVMKLRESIKSASSLWKDAKFTELFSSIGEIANTSKEAIVAGDRCSVLIDKFEKISSEKY